MSRAFLQPVLCALLGSALLLAAQAAAQVRPVYDTGAAALARTLQRLQTTASVMHTGAHPDDEDSALLAYLARREHARTAYVSLTRGDGGQNVIGPELSEPLGVIRSEELLQARTLDGAEQFFTRAVDYGFSKYRSEAARLWDEQIVLGDLVRAIRLVRPDVIVSRFTGTPADGHGHHQFAGYLTPAAAAAAADPDLFREHFTDGLAPWQVKKLYVSEGFRPHPDNTPTLRLNTGERDPVLGRSYFEVAMEGRSQQKTQQMGSPELRGLQQSGLRLIDSVVAAGGQEQSVFDNIDTSIAGIAQYDESASSEFRALLDELDEAAASALGNYDPLQPARLSETLAQGLQLARRASAMTDDPEARRLLDEKVSEFEQALLEATGVSVAAISDSETVVDGNPLRAAIRVFVAAPALVDVTSIDLRAPDGWVVSKVAGAQQLATERGWRRSEVADAEALFEVGVPPGFPPTQPYWLERPRQGFEFDWSTAGGARNLPFRPGLMRADVVMRIRGQELRIHKEVEYRTVDRVRGDLRRPVNVVPAMSIAPATGLLIVPVADAKQTFELAQTVSNNTATEMAGTATFEIPQGWELSPREANFSLPGNGSSTTLSFRLTIPAVTTSGSYVVTAAANAAGKTFRQTMQKIAYPHIRTHRVYRPSSVQVNVLDVRVARVKVGYIMGSGDRVPEAIRRLGLEVTLLEDDDLATGDLSRFDTIVVGIRASQARPAFVAYNGRLLDFARQGGTLIVQYQQRDYVSRNLPPYPVEMDTSVRVVDETAPVRILEPRHPVFNFPNRIVAADFDGWVQERNGYTFTSFDREHYTPLLESHDEGDAESIGGMMYAEIGSGKYVYSSYAWFRQLPAGVPGSYRIIANLLSLPEAE